MGDPDSSQAGIVRAYWIGLVGFLWLDYRRETALPAPTGTFAVGRSLYDWVDDKTADVLATAPGIKRELLVWIWYPATPGQPGAVVDDYVPASVRAPASPIGGPLILRPLGWLFRLSTRELAKVRGHSFRNAEVSQRQPPYPVVFMLAGGIREIMSYSMLAEDLASHGYVVVGVDAPYARIGLFSRRAASSNEDPRTIWSF